MKSTRDESKMGCFTGYRCVGSQKCFQKETTFWTLIQAGLAMRAGVWFAIGLAFATASVLHANERDPKSSYQYLNQVRDSAGMIPFDRNANLERAAMNHAIYLKENNVTGHFQQAGKPHFTGVNPWDRTAAAGYLSALVGENVAHQSTSQSYINSPIDGLMSAIYHRFTFLSFEFNEVGLVNHVDQSTGILDAVHVTNLGNTYLNQLCQSSLEVKSGKIYTTLCADPRTRLPAAQVDQAKSRVMASNPDWVVWPAKYGQNVPPVFYEESPDPLPDFSVSGYPVSIEFNPHAYSQAPAVTSFKLFHHTQNQLVQPVRILNQHTDPNRLFTAHQHALFPLERLEWASVYRAEVTFSHVSGTQTIDWLFTTTDLSMPVIEVGAKGEVVSLKSGQQAALYLPPEKTLPQIRSFRVSHSFDQLQLELIDQNTFLAQAEGRSGRTAEVTLPGGHRFVLKLQ